jgi:hypothetical protein
MLDFFSGALVAYDVRLATKRATLSTTAAEVFYSAGNFEFPT